MQDRSHPMPDSSSHRPIAYQPIPAHAILIPSQPSSVQPISVHLTIPTTQSPIHTQQRPHTQLTHHPLSTPAARKNRSAPHPRRPRHRHRCGTQTAHGSQESAIGLAGRRGRFRGRRERRHQHPRARRNDHSGARVSAHVCAEAGRW